MKAIKTTGPRKAWETDEILAVIGLYNEFLAHQVKGKKYTKASRVRAVAESIGRSKGSVEAKLMNISGIRHARGLEYVTGYKPLNNAQGLLVELVSISIQEVA